jgi:hypothetical protein
LFQTVWYVLNGYSGLLEKIDYFFEEYSRCMPDYRLPPLCVVFALSAGYEELTRSCLDTFRDNLLALLDPGRWNQ